MIKYSKYLNTLFKLFTGMTIYLNYVKILKNLT